jgi:GntR family transcriptional regulator
MAIDKRHAAPGPVAFRLDHGSGVPTYLQLVQQVERALRLGLLEPGDQLPTVREMVESLAINPNTVMKAYRELEHRGLAAGRPGQGTFITAKLQRVTGAEQAGLARRLADWMREATAAGLDDQSMAAMFDVVLRDLHGYPDGVSA